MSLRDYFTSGSALRNYSSLVRLGDPMEFLGWNPDCCLQDTLPAVPSLQHPNDLFFFPSLFLLSFFGNEVA